MEICRIEFAQHRELWPRADDKPASLVIGSFALPECLQVSVNGHQRHSEHFAELGLGEWERTRVGLDEASEPSSMELLAKEMRNPRGAVPTAIVGDTFAEDRRIY
jgi:hypothetical protein